MLDGVYCKGQFVEYNGYYWKEKIYKSKFTKKTYYHQEFFVTDPNEFNEISLHRFIFAQHNGPIPKKNEKGEFLIVHHLNEDELNNTIQNLELITRGEHSKITRENLKQTNPDAYKMPPRSAEARRKTSIAMKGRIPSKEAVANQQAAKRLNKLKFIKAQIAAANE